MPEETVPHRAMITACAMQGRYSASDDEITWVLTSCITAAAVGLIIFLPGGRGAALLLLLLMRMPRKA